MKAQHLLDITDISTALKHECGHAVKLICLTLFMLFMLFLCFLCFGRKPD
jgi:hypothetical protein